MRLPLPTSLLRGLVVLLLAIPALFGAATSASAAGVQAGTLSATEVDLGDVPLGSAISKTVTLRSTGTAPLEFNSILPGPDGYEMSLFAPRQYDPLAPGAERVFTLVADPTRVGAVDSTLSLQYGGGEGVDPKQITVRVKYNAIKKPVLPYVHFDLRMIDDFWIGLLAGNTTVSSIGGTTGSTPGTFVFKAHSGKIAADNTGVLSSWGGLSLKRWSTVNWNKIGLDLTRGHLTAVTEKGGPRVDVADLGYIRDDYDIEGNPVTWAFVALNARSAAQFNKVGLRPTVQAGAYVGSIEILKR